MNRVIVDRYPLVSVIPTILAVALLCAQCAAPGNSGPQDSGPADSSPVTLEQLFAGEVTVLDLSHTLSSTNPVWREGAESPFQYEVLAAHESGLPVMGAFRTAEHYGTHIDAPIHGGDHLPTVDEIELANLFAPAVVIDVSAAGAQNADYALSIEDIRNWEAEHGRMPTGSIVLLYTGWSEKWDDPEAYLNRDAEGRLHFPGFSGEAAQFLVDERSIKGVGIDNMSIDPAAGNGFPAHGVVNGSGRIHLENVANVHLLPATGAYLIVAPVKIERGSGGPVRIFGIVP